MTRIVKGWPPNIEDISKVLPVTERNIARSIYLRAIDRRLSHPMYGKIITAAAAMQEIKH